MGVQIVESELDMDFALLVGVGDTTLQDMAQERAAEEAKRTDTKLPHTNPPIEITRFHQRLRIRQAP